MIHLRSKVKGAGPVQSSHLQEKLKRKSSTVKRIKIRLSLKVKAVEVWRVGVLAAAVEGAGGVVREAPGAVAHVWAPGGQRSGRRTGANVAQSRGGRRPAHQQAHCPHRSGITAVAMAKTIGDTVGRSHGEAASGPP